MSQAPSASTTEPGLQSKVKKPFHKAKVWFKDHFSSGRSLPSTSPNSRSSTPRPEATDEGRRPLQAVQSLPALIPTPSSGPLSTTPMGHELFTAPSATLDSQPPTVAAPLNMPAMPAHVEGGHLDGSGSSDGPALDAIFSPMAVATPGTTEPSRSEPDLKPDAPASPAPKDRFGTVLNVVSQILKVATAATAFFPPAQSAIGGVSGTVDMVKTMKQNGVDREAVVRILKEALRRVEMCKSIESPSEEMLKMLSTLERDIQENLGSIEDAIKESWWKRLVEGDAQEMVKCYSKLSSSLNFFIMQTTIRIDGQIHDLKGTTAELKSMMRENSQAISQILAKTHIQELRRVTVAEYTTGPQDLRGPCTPGTRKQILGDLMAWATDDTNTQVYWLSGMAGTGKTTIAYSFCKLLQEVGLLATSYFCSRSDAATMEPRAFLPTIAVHLAAWSPSFRQSFLDTLQDPDNLNIRDKIIEEQFTALILKPAEALSTSIIPKRRILVYDGADESSNMKEVAKLISLFLKNAAKLPFKVFISSRRDEAIKLEFGQEDLASRPTTLILHDIEQSLVEADIRQYIRERLEHFPNTLSDSALDTLAEQSGTLFVYAAVLCSYLVPKPGTPEQMVKRRLKTILAGSSTTTAGTRARPHDQLDKIYRQILTLPEENTDIWPVLLVILTTQIPLSMASISEIVDIEEDRVSQVIEALHSVLTGSDLQEHPVTIFHASFRDFLQDTSRGKEFSSHILANHDHLAHQCLKIMEETLISNDFSEVLRKDSHGKAVEIHRPSPRLAYACANWFIHLLELDAEQLAGSQLGVEAFFSKLVLRWVECMSRLGYLEDAVRSLRKIELSDIMISADLHLAAMNARRMILQCFNLIQDQPTEIYNSALAWLPKASEMRGRFQSQIVWQITCGLQSDWGVCESVMQEHSDWVHSVSFSPDGRRVASGSSDKTVRIWNIETGQEERKLEGHSDTVRSVSFSPDGRRLASGSDDETVRIWNIETGQEERKLEGHSDTVWSVSLSPDGRRVASGSSDKTVRIWNIETGQEERKLEGHSDWVHSVSFSPDGRRVASGSDDKTVRIWNIERGQEERKLEGHSDWVWSVSFSPDGRRVASGSSDKTVRIWNIETGQEERKLEGHSDQVQSVSFSPDGRRVASGSDDETVRIWNIETGQEERKLEGHSDWGVRSVSFSPDGRRVTSESDDDTVQIWDVETGQNVKTSEAEVTTQAHPPEYPIALDHDGWLHYHPLKSRLWLLPQFQRFSCSASFANSICLGYRHGEILIVRYTGI